MIWITNKSTVDYLLDFIDICGPGLLGPLPIVMAPKTTLIADFGWAAIMSRGRWEMKRANDKYLGFIASN